MTLSPHTKKKRPACKKREEEKKHTQLPLDIIQPTNLLGKSTLESIGIRVKLYPTTIRVSLFSGSVGSKGGGVSYVSELHLAKFTQSADDLSSDFVGDVELGQAHVRRAEEGVPRSHGGREAACSRYFSARTRSGQVLNVRIEVKERMGY